MGTEGLLSGVQPLPPKMPNKNLKGVSAKYIIAKNSLHEPNTKCPVKSPRPS